jgi:alkanesulfonate monooxygenase SsuD/methylene tetrahydromethanopterin reductase-like flavin-dependent oxidoreductase (luciferase family)
MMKYGLIYPQTEYGQDPQAICDYAQTAEDLGFDHIVAYDHVLGANPGRPGGLGGMYTHASAFLEPFTLFSYMAAVTQRIEFATEVIILPQRQTALVAKQAATLDVLNGGRTRLGVGVGWNQVEFEATPTPNRVRPPVQRPIPVWFGGHDDRALRRCAAIGDGWMLPKFANPEAAKPLLEKLMGYREEAGRGGERFGLEARIPYGNGNPKILESWIRKWHSLGVTHVVLNTMDSGLDAPRGHLGAMEEFVREARSS